MKTKKSFPLFVCILLICILLQHAQGQTWSIKFLTNASDYTVPQELFGACTESVFSNYDISTSDAQNLPSKIAATGLKVLYYPGGSVARVTHYRPGSSGSYGISSIESECVFEQHVDGVPDKGEKLDYDVDLNPGGNPRCSYLSNNYVDQLIYLCHNAGISKVILCANMMYGDAGEFYEMITHLNSASPAIVVYLVILNTEVHLTSDRDIIPNVHAYLNKCQPFIDMINTKFNNVGGYGTNGSRIEIALDAAPAGSSNDYYNTWNEEVVNYIDNSSTDNVDAGAINWWWDITNDDLYVLPSLCGTYTCDGGATTVDDDGDVITQGFTKMNTYFDTDLPGDITDFVNDGFTKMHIVQWGIDRKGNSSNECGGVKCEDGTPANYHNRYLENMFIVRRILGLIDNNSVSSPPLLFESATFMKVASSLNHDPIYGNGIDLDQTSSCSNNSLSYSASKTAFDFITGIIGQKNATLSEIKDLPSNTVISVPSKDDYGFYLFYDGTYYWLVAYNFTTTDRQIKVRVDSNTAATFVTSGYEYTKTARDTFGSSYSLQTSGLTFTGSNKTMTLESNMIVRIKVTP